ncbi:hypothetical protein PG984_003038 [Apiospora sp. TS-2023a]
MVDFCGASTFDPESVPKDKKKPAPASDCEQLAQFFEEEKQLRTWLFVWANLDTNVDATKFNTITSKGNCGIAIRAASDFKDCPQCSVSMGNGDAVDIIRTSIEKFGKSGKDGKFFAGGKTHCRSNRWGNSGSDRDVEWILYNPYP